MKESTISLRTEAFMERMRRKGINFHSVLMQQGSEVVYECYWAPFTPDRPHRMYSVTKTFVAIAVGCLLDEGKITLDDPIIRYFPDKLPENVHPWLQEQTIRHMLMMSTCFAGINWFRPGVTDRTAYYFAQTPNRPAGTLFDYDSTGSYILGVLVERVAGMPLLDYLKQKVLNRIGGFENAQMLQTPDGTPWGDSALLCTPRALLNFARFVMNLGTWAGERLLSESYLREATTALVTNDLDCLRAYNAYGYGYQIWKSERGFSFHGMGGQYAVCVPDSDFIFVCTGDNQYNARASEEIFDAVFEHLVPGDRPADDAAARLGIAHGAASSPLADRISGRTFTCADNPMGIGWFRLDFTGDEGCFVYSNAQGEKALRFGLQKNVFGKFPQLGYSDDRGNVHELTDFRYDCAASAGWLDGRTLQLRVQIIDRYFGSMTAVFGFRDENTVAVRMVKAAEDFLGEYQGWMAAETKP